MLSNNNVAKFQLNNKKITKILLEIKAQTSKSLMNQKGSHNQNKNLEFIMKILYLKTYGTRQEIEGLKCLYQKIRK